jgi:hypothetical protein
MDRRYTSDPPARIGAAVITRSWNGSAAAGVGGLRYRRPHRFEVASAGTGGVENDPNRFVPFGSHRSPNDMISAKRVTSLLQHEKQGSLFLELGTFSEPSAGGCRGQIPNHSCWLGILTLSNTANVSFRTICYPPHGL